MVFGQLLDTRGEFFIQRSAEFPDAASSAAAASGEVAAERQQDARAAEWHLGFQVSVMSMADEAGHASDAVDILPATIGPGRPAGKPAIGLITQAC